VDDVITREVVSKPVLNEVDALVIFPDVAYVVVMTGKLEVLELELFSVSEGWLVLIGEVMVEMRVLV
jgi:hypothetical protein